MQQLTIDNLQAYAKGCAILGSGGGGDVRYRQYLVAGALKEYGPVSIINEVEPEDLIVPVAFLGAPLVSKEKHFTLQSFEAVIQRIEKYYGKKPKALMPAEIGGGNGLTPFCIAGKLGLPVFDADLIGRAFPTIKMTAAYLAGFSPTPVFLADALGQTVVIESTIDSVERLVRASAVAMGSQCAIATYIMKGSQISLGSVKGSVSGAFSTSFHGISLGKDIDILDVISSIEGGFLKGRVILEGGIEIFFQNEYLLVKREGEILGKSPDIICLLEKGVPVGTEELRFGMTMDLQLFEAPSVWKTPHGLKLAEEVL
ncbi:MAG: DUF917 domain-containing protein [Simkania sp.]|nr:DUF917 domain-containing protein [Simkania sp.]